MQPSTQTWNTFYQNFGRLCYAVAAADRKVSDAEVKEVKRLVSEEWLNLESSKDSFGTDASYQIEIVFDWLRENMPSADSAFDLFSDFHQEHPHFFTTELNKKILKTADSIADAFHGKNKSELAYLNKLKHLLK